MQDTPINRIFSHKKKKRIFQTIQNKLLIFAFLLQHCRQVLDFRFQIESRWFSGSRSRRSRDTGNPTPDRSAANPAPTIARPTDAGGRVSGRDDKVGTPGT